MSWICSIQRAKDAEFVRALRHIREKLAHPESALAVLPELPGRLEQLAAAASSGLYDVLAHPDLVKVWGAGRPRPERDPRHYWEPAVEAIAAAGIAVEVSTAGLRKPVGEIYPEPGLLARFRRAGVPATLSSDAHAPEDVARDYPTAVAALRGAGYETITRFARREPTQAPLR